MSTNRDLAIVNLPLSKRGDIDAKIDRYKANRRADARNREKANHAERVKARKIVVELPAQRVAEFASKAGLTAMQAKKRLLSEARFNPCAVIRAFGGAA